MRVYTRDVVVSYSFPRYLNTSAPFDLHEHSGVWKHPNFAPWGFDEYKDFEVRPVSTYFPRGRLTFPADQQHLEQ